MYIVIIGNGIAGNSAAQAALRHPGARVTLIDRSPMPFHSACVLPDYIADSVDSDKVILKPFSSRRLKRIFGKEVQAIDLLEKKILLEKKTIPYDKLILATGSRPSIPPVPGTGLNGNFCLKHLWDADQIRQFPAKEAVVVGSGLIGLEVVAALKKRGQSVTLIENQDRLGPRIFDSPVAKWVQKILEGNGIRICIKESVSRIFGKSHVETLKTSKRVLKTDLVIWATGMQPESKLAKQMGLRLGDQGGVVVQESMETSLSGVYAAGDVTEFPDPLLARSRLNLFWYVGAAQGRVAGLNSVGIRSELPPFLQMGTAHLLETTLAFVGYTGEELLQKDLCPETETLVTGQGLLHQVFLDGRLVGLQMVNPTRQEILMANYVLRTQRKNSPIPWYFRIPTLHHIL
jgi:NADPH-dependent 2,4-dienoyl-CoA reductase/sulfur reductase-like enzyme